jgi:exopolyphosphatase / guanosine-5'-triphosphate,3'-diphosphate pyrophosphatase
MRCACVDIGSNTTRLLVAESGPAGLCEVVAERRFLRLPAGGSAALSAERIAAVARVVAEQVAVARRHGVPQPRVVATAAIRSAPNREELVDAVERAAGVTVAVLSSDDEARLAFDGVTRTLADAPPGRLGVADIGGGSSELVVGTVAGGVEWCASLPIGSGLLADVHLQGDPPGAAALEAARAHVAAALSRAIAPRPVAAFAVGGSATSLRRLVGPELTLDSLDRALAALAGRPAADAAEAFGLHAERARLLPAGLLLLRGAVEAFGGVPLRIAAGGLREGVLLQELDRQDA